MDQRYRFHNHGNELIENIQKELGSRFWPEYRLSGVTFFGNKGRILKMVNNSKWLYFEFNVPVPVVDGLEVLTEKEARDKHMGTCRWVYKGNSLNLVQSLIKEALKKY